MGIKNLIKLIKEYAPNVLEPIKFQDLAGHTIGIDAPIAIYQWHSVGKNILNARGDPINHIQGAFFRTVKLLCAGIRPIYIFDGTPPAIKGRTLAMRRERNVRNVHSVHIKYVTPSHKIFTDVIEMLNIMKIPIIMAPSEAEAQGSVMSAHNIIYGIATEDTDALALGAKYIIRGLSADRVCTRIDTAALLKSLDLTPNQFVDLCILLGCDYTGTLPGIGYKKALRLIKKYASIENILIGENITPGDNFDYHSARNVFLNPLVNDMPRFEYEKLDPQSIQQLHDFLVNVHGLSEQRIKKSLTLLSEYF